MTPKRQKGVLHNILRPRRTQNVSGKDVHPARVTVVQLRERALVATADTRG
jgi:hypothetical protein